MRLIPFESRSAFRHGQDFDQTAGDCPAEMSSITISPGREPPCAPIDNRTKFVPASITGREITALNDQTILYKKIQGRSQAMSIHQLTQIPILFALMLLINLTKSITVSQADRGAGGPDDLYHYYDCSVSEYPCRPSPWDRGYDLRHETTMQRFYKEFRQERDRELRNCRSG